MEDDISKYKNPVYIQLHWMLKETPTTFHLAKPHSQQLHAKLPWLQQRSREKSMKLPQKARNSTVKRMNEKLLPKK